MKPKKKMVPIPLKKKRVWLSCLKVTIVELVKKILAPYTPEKNFSDPVCCEKNFPAQGKIPPPYLFNGCSLKTAHRNPEGVYVHLYLFIL